MKKVLIVLVIALFVMVGCRTATGRNTLGGAAGGAAVGGAFGSMSGDFGKGAAIGAGAGAVGGYLRDQHRKGNIY